MNLIKKPWDFIRVLYVNPNILGYRARVSQSCSYMNSSEQSRPRNHPCAWSTCGYGASGCALPRYVQGCWLTLRAQLQEGCGLTFPRIAMLHQAFLSGCLFDLVEILTVENAFSLVVFPLLSLFLILETLDRTAEWTLNGFVTWASG